MPGKKRDQRPQQHNRTKGAPRQDKHTPQKAISQTPFPLTLTAMTHGGQALGRHEGRAIFVPYAIPGEEITARIVQDKGRYAYATGVTLHEPSEYRVYPECPFFGPTRCGGCHWQHIDYPGQLIFKRQVLIDQLTRVGGIQNPLVYETIASPSPWAYRTHITLHADPSGVFGFIATDDRTIIAIDECHIIRPELLEMLEVLDFEKAEDLSPSKDEVRPKGHNIREIRLQVGSDSRDRLVILSTYDDDEPSVEIALPVAVAHLRNDGNAVPLIGTKHVHYTIMGHAFRVTAGGFFQVNLDQAVKLVELVMLHAAPTKGDNVLDLYSGVGLFTAFLAEQAGLVTAIESAPNAVADADHNLAAFTNVSLIEGTVEDALPALVEEGQVFDIAVIDPPRAGMEPGALDALVACKPSKIIYVSCDPATLARDSKRLLAAGYGLTEAYPIDMFPQTYHIETVAIFHRVNA
jgi:23S rRNA (uracil1939-C5)-methyltransferase